MKINKILFPTDFSQPANRALDHALVLAHRLKATLTMLHIEVPYAADPNNPSYAFPDLDDLFRAIRELARQRLEDPELPVMSGDIEIDHEVKRGISPAAEILEFAEEDGSEMIVMGTHGRGGLGHFLLGSTAEKVVRGAKVPVLTIHHGEDLLLAREGKYEKILVPIDFSESSRHALKQAAGLAEHFGSELVAVHVLEPVLSPQNLFAGDPSPVAIDGDLTQRSEEAFREFAEGTAPESTQFKLLSGTVHKELIAAIKRESADLVVVADRGWSAVERLLLGGTTEKLIRKSPVPVLTVK